MTGIAKVARLVKGFFSVCCILICSTILFLLFAIFVFPFVLLSKSFQRRLQTLAQSAWVYVLLGVTENSADSKIFITLPVEFGVEQEALVYQKLKAGFEFDEIDVKRLSSQVPPPPSSSPHNEHVRGERDIVISNHQIYMDWIYIWSIMARLGREGNVKIILKRSLLNVPIFGLGMRMMDFIFLHRNWEVDKVKFGYRLRRLVFGKMPFSLVIFPEGTTLSQTARIKSNSFAKDNNLPKPEHTIVPRVTGLQFALSTLGQHVDGILDFTFGYTGTSTSEYPEKTFPIEALFFGGVAPPTIHAHVRYHPIKSIPYLDPEAFKLWLYKIYQEKEDLMKDFYRDGCFKGGKSLPVPIASRSSIFIVLLATVVATITLSAIIAAIFLRFNI